MKILINVRSFNSTLKNLKLIKSDGLTIRATNSIELISNKYPIEMNIEVPGDIISKGQIFIPEETLKMMEGFKDGQFIITDKSVTCGNKEIEYFSEHDIRLLNYGFGTVDFTISPSEFKRMLEVSYATGNDESRPSLSGICIRKNRFIALDGHIGAIRYSTEFNYDGDIIITSDTWKILKKLKPRKEIEVYINRDEVRFKLDDIKLDSKLMSGKFFNLEELFIDGNKLCTVNVNELMESIKIMEKIRYSGDILLVELTILDDKLTLECKGLNNIFKDILNVESNVKEEFKIAFDMKYFKPVISQYKDSIKMEFTSSVNPLIVKTVGQADMALPVRVGK